MKRRVKDYASGDEVDVPVGYKVPYPEEEGEPPSGWKPCGYYNPFTQELSSSKKNDGFVRLIECTGE